MNNKHVVYMNIAWTFNIFHKSESMHALREYMMSIKTHLQIQLCTAKVNFSSIKAYMRWIEINGDYLKHQVNTTV